MTTAAPVTYLEKDQGKGRLGALSMMETDALLFQNHDEENGGVMPGRPLPGYPMFWSSLDSQILVGMLALCESVIDPPQLERWARWV